MVYYLVGGSVYDNSDYFLGTFMDAGGNSEEWGSQDFVRGDIEDDDPFWSLGLNTGVTPITRGNKQVEIGLFDNYRIKITTSGIYGWVGPGDDDFSALGGGGGATVLNDLTDVVISGTPADNELLAWDNGSSKWINQTAGEAGLSLSGHGHGQLHDESHSLASHSSEAHSELTDYNAETDVKHLTDAQLGALHAIYTLESHNNTYHSTNYHTESDGTGVVTVHSDVNSVGSGDIITTNERNALHAIYTLEVHDNDEHDPDFCVDDDSRLSDSRTPTQHAMDSTTYHSRTDIITLDSSSSFHGFLKKLDNNASNFMNGQGNWAVPTGTYSLEVHDNDEHNPNYLANISEDTSPEMLIEDALASDGDYQGIVITITNAQTFGLAVYVSANNTVALADKDSISTMPPLGISVGTNKVLIQGTIREDDWDWTANDFIYISDNGTLTNNIVGFGVADIVYCIGMAVDANTIAIKPMHWVELSDGVLNHNTLDGLNDGTDYEHITQTQKDALHAIYTLESHNNTYHSTNYHSESDGTGAVTIHSGITDAGSGIIISDGERTNLHSIYTLESHNNTYHSTNYEEANANIQSHVGGTPPTSAHHVKTVSSDISLDSLAEKSHDNLDDVSINDHHDRDHNNTEHTTNYLANLSEDGSPQLGADLDLNGKTINCNGNLGSDHTFEGLVIDNITNAQAFGKFVYITSAHTTALCDKDSIVLSIGISVGTGKVLYSGTIRDDSFSGLAAGNPVYIGDDGNPTDDISGYTTGDMVQCVGVAIDTNLILVKDICWVEVA